MEFGPGCGFFLLLKCHWREREREGVSGESSVKWQIGQVSLRREVRNFRECKNNTEDYLEKIVAHFMK